MREPPAMETGSTPSDADVRGDAPSNGRRPHSWWRQTLRLIRLRLVIPVLRSHHPPEHSARGVMIGLMWAMTPLVGIQMMAVLGTWFVASRLFSWHFSLVLGLAWTWITNAFTILPFYYAYYVTGQLMLGHWDDVTGFESFVALWEGTFGADLGFWAALYAYVVDIVAGWGLPLVVGSIPWVVVSGVLGYWLSLRISRRSAAARAERRAQADRRQASRAGDLTTAAQTASDGGESASD